MTHGGKRVGAGRKAKAEEQKLIENLTPMNPMALESLKKGLEKKEQWAVKLFFEYFYGRPQQRVFCRYSLSNTLNYDTKHKGIVYKIYNGVSSPFNYS